jgi:DNA uptake protein ComE-like DNA-binding protein
MEGFAVMEKVDLNNATPEDIEGVCGLEPPAVKSLVRNRPLKNYDQLEKVPGMGPLLVMTLRKQGCLISTE